RPPPPLPGRGLPGGLHRGADARGPRGLPGSERGPRAVRRRGLQGRGRGVAQPAHGPRLIPETAMSTGTVGLLLAGVALALAWPVPVLLARARWPMHAPVRALLLWQAIGLAGGAPRGCGGPRDPVGLLPARPPGRDRRAGVPAAAATPDAAPAAHGAAPDPCAHARDRRGRAGGVLHPPRRRLRHGPLAGTARPPAPR